MATNQTSCDQNTQGWNLRNPRPLENYDICETNHSDSEIIRIIRIVYQNNNQTCEIQKYNVFTDAWDSIPFPHSFQTSPTLYSYQKKIIFSRDGKMLYLCIDIGALDYYNTQIFAWEISQTNPNIHFVQIQGLFDDLLFICGRAGQFLCFNTTNGECRLWLSKENTLSTFRIDLSDMYPLTDYISHRQDHCVLQYIPKCKLICIFIVNNTKKSIRVKTININGIYACFFGVFV